MFNIRDLSRRLCEVRVALYGVHGGPELARRLGLPAPTWRNYEQGITIPGEILLAFIDATGVDPGWLLDGGGPMFSRSCQPPDVRPGTRSEPR
jgi:hypothetical protein